MWIVCRELALYELSMTKWRKVKTSFNLIYPTIADPIWLTMECGTVVSGYTIRWTFESIDKNDARLIELRYDIPHRQVAMRLNKFLGHLVVLKKTTIMDVLQWLLYEYDDIYLPIGNTATLLHNYLSNHQELRELNCIFHSCENKACYWQWTKQYNYSNHFHCFLDRSNLI